MKKNGEPVRAIFPQSVLILAQNAFFFTDLAIFMLIICIFTRYLAARAALYLH